MLNLTKEDLALLREALRNVKLDSKKKSRMRYELLHKLDAAIDFKDLIEEIERKV